MTTAPKTKGKKIVSDHKIFCGDAILGANVLKDFWASISDLKNPICLQLSPLQYSHTLSPTLCILSLASVSGLSPHSNTQTPHYSPTGLITSIQPDMILPLPAIHPR